MVDSEWSSSKPSRILEYLYLGNRHNAKDLRALKELGVKFILNVTPTRNTDPETGCPNFFEKERTFTYKRIAIFDNKGEDILAHMQEAYDFIEQGRHYGIVFVHCNKGISRSVSFVVGYLMKKQGMTLDEALDFVRSRRSIANPNEAFMVQLQRYNQQLNPHRAAMKARKEEAKTFATSNARSIGPSVPTGMPEARDDKPEDNGEAVSIGPSLPLHLRNRRTEPVNPSNDTTSALSRAIGPELPAHLRKTRAPLQHQHIPDGGSADPDPSPLASIGPDLPPLPSPRKPDSETATAAPIGDQLNVAHGNSELAIAVRSSAPEVEEEIAPLVGSKRKTEVEDTLTSPEDNPAHAKRKRDSVDT